MKTLPFRVRFVGGALTLVLLLTAFPINSARAATIAELQAQIQVLMTQVALLQQQLSAQTNTGCPTFTRDLWVGNSGAEVTKLQNYLIGRGHAIPAGATGYFGEQTRVALSAFQNANGISPASGIFGPLTRAKVAGLCSIVVPTTPAKPTTPTTPTTPTATLRGEASFDRFRANDGEDVDVEEGDTGAEVMEISFRVRDGDAKLNRVELVFAPDDSNNEQDPWDTFSTIRIKQGSKQLGTIDGGQKKNWTEDSPASDQYLIRFSSINQTLREDDEVELTVEVSIPKSVRGTDDGEIWSLFVPNNGIRALDADNVTVFTGNSNDAVTINLDRAGDADELIVRNSDDDPEESSLRLKDDGRSGWIPVFAFDIDTDDSRNDIEIRNLPITVIVDNGSLTTLVHEARLVVDGTAYTRETITNGTPGTISFDFNRGELVIDNGDRVTAVLELNFKALAESHGGTILSAHVDASDFDAEGADDLRGSQLSGSATSRDHILITHGADVGTPTTATAVVSNVSGVNNDYITFDISVPVTAFGQDIYIPTGLTGVSYELLDSQGNVIIASSSPFVDSSARKRDGYFFISEGRTETLTLNVVYVPGVNGTRARLQLTAINYSDKAVAPTDTWSALPASTYSTPSRIVVD